MIIIIFVTLAYLVLHFTIEELNIVETLASNTLSSIKNKFKLNLFLQNLVCKNDLTHLYIIN